MKLQGWMISLFILLSLSAFSQEERKFIRRGNDAFQEKHYTQSEVNYRKALENEQNSFEALFNVGDALYKEEKYEEAAQQFNQLTNQDASDSKKARAWHNLGNALLKADKLKESISAYKQALRLNPGDVETKHNLTYAMRKLKEQQQKKKNKKQNQQKQDQQNQQNQQKKQQEQDKQKQQGSNQQQQQDQQEKEQKKQPQGGSPQKQQITKEDAKRLLQALENDEKQLQKKLKKKKAKAANAKTTKNW